MRAEKTDLHVHHEVDRQRFEQFVREFGPADGLTNQQLAALTAFCSDITNTWAATIAAELLRGQPQDLDDDSDSLDETNPRVVQAASAAYLQHVCPACASDGGYGTADADQLYQCPDCRVVWWPAPNADMSVKTRFGNWIQRAKIAWTSY